MSPTFTSPLASGTVTRWFTSQFAYPYLFAISCSLAFASCGNDGLDGKSFSYEKIEVEFENEELQEAMNKLLKDGQSIADYFAENYLSGMGEMTYTFKDGKMYGEVDGESLGEGIAYELDGKNIVLANDDMPEGTTLTYEGGKLVMAMEMEIPLVLTSAKVGMKIYYK